LFGLRLVLVAGDGKPAQVREFVVVATLVVVTVTATSVAVGDVPARFAVEADPFATSTRSGLGCGYSLGPVLR
jgi:hypothetical protein